MGALTMDVTKPQYRGQPHHGGHRQAIRNCNKRRYEPAK